MPRANTHAHFFLILLGASLVLGFILIRPLLSAILVGAILAVVFHPIYRRILRLTRKRGITAGLTILLVFIIIFLPLFFVGSRIVGEAADVYSYVAANGNLEELIGGAEEKISVYIPGVSFETSSAQTSIYIKEILKRVIENIGPIFQGLAQAALYIAVVLLACYYFLKDGTAFRDKIMELSPLKGIENKKIIEKVRKAITSVVRGSLVIGVIQGILTGLGFWIFGVSNPALWGTLAVVAALIPGIGTAVINIPGVLVLFATGHPLNAALLLLWGLVAVGLIDNLLRPYLIGRDTKMHAFLIFISVIGGILTFGPVGFLIGPLILSFILALIDIYPSIILGKK